MKVWQTIRETVISAYNGLMDYDRKIPKWKRDQALAKRNSEKKARMAKDADLEMIREERRTKQELARTENQQKAGELARRKNMTAQVEVIPTRNSAAKYDAPQPPQVIYVTHQAPIQNVTVQREGCVKGCFLIVVVIGVIIFAMGKCTVETAKNLSRMPTLNDKTEIPASIDSKSQSNPPVKSQGAENPSK